MKFFILPGWGWILVAMALYIFYAAARGRRARREYKRDRLEERREELLDMLRKKKALGDGKENEEN